MKWIVCGLAIASTIAFAASATVPGSVSPRAAIEVKLLRAHNLERDRVGVARLRWNPRLAQEAQAWADTLASSGRFEHSQDRADEGENLWMGTAGRYTTNDMIGGFVEEVRYFKRGQFPQVSKTGSWHDVGHYTQLIWPSTREVGCAVSRAKADEVLVCRYFPAGNVMGEKIG